MVERPLSWTLRPQKRLLTSYSFTAFVLCRLNCCLPVRSCHIMAEIGDSRRFSHRGALTAFAGVDPGVNQSGTYNQKNVRTSKRGSAPLRKTLFQVMEGLLKSSPENDAVYKFISKKRAEGKPYYVYMTAGANKFLRIYYGRVKEYLLSLPNEE